MEYLCGFCHICGKGIYSNKPYKIDSNLVCEILVCSECHKKTMELLKQNTKEDDYPGLVDETKNNNRSKFMTNNELRDAFTYLYKTAKTRNDSWRRMAHQISQEWGDGSEEDRNDINNNADEVAESIE